MELGRGDTKITHVRYHYCDPNNSKENRPGEFLYHSKVPTVLSPRCDCGLESTTPKYVPLNRAKCPEFPNELRINGRYPKTNGHEGRLKTGCDMVEEKRLF